MAYNEEDFLQLSGLQHFRFCRRQWALIHIEHQWAENYRTIDGAILHENAHDADLQERRGDRFITRGVSVYSAELGVSGQCDVLEYYRGSVGIPLFGKEGLWQPYPVEYKRGRPREDTGDTLQLCAQAMCLESMLCCDIPEGALYYGEIRRRERVSFTLELRRGAGAAGGNARAVPSGLYPQGQAHQILQCLLLEGAVPAQADEKQSRLRVSPGGHGGITMKQLLNTLFVTSEDIYLSLEGENVLANRDKTVVARYPLHTLQAIVSFSYAGASPALMGKCAEAGIGLAFCSPHGRFLARTYGESSGNVLLRREQYRIADDPARSCEIARTMIFGKLSNGAASIQRTLRDHAPRVADCGLENAAANLRAMLPQVLAAAGLDTLRGIEGAAATAYFGVLDHMLLSRREAFFFHGRSRRPPLDQVNAMLSFAYSLLAHDCASALESLGLDSYVGFLHRDRPGRQSLALDLMEELRPCMADRFVLTLVNNRMLRPEDFQMQDSGAVLLSDDGRRKFLKTWQERKQDTLTHPYLGEKLSWGMTPYAQALLLARCLRGDLDGYPPFLWKCCYAGADHIRCKHRGRRRAQAPAADR